MKRPKLSHRIKEVAEWMLTIDCRKVDEELAHRGLDMLEQSIKTFIDEPSSLTPNQAADRYGVSRETVRNYVIKHNLEGTQPPPEPCTRIYPSKTIEALDKIFLKK